MAPPSVRVYCTSVRSQFFFVLETSTALCHSKLYFTNLVPFWCPESEKRKKQVLSFGPKFVQNLSHPSSNSTAFSSTSSVVIATCLWVFPYSHIRSLGTGFSGMRNAIYTSSGCPQLPPFPRGSPTWCLYIYTLVVLPWFPAHLFFFFGRPPYCPISFLSICPWASSTFSPPSEQSSLSVPPSYNDELLPSQICWETCRSQGMYKSPHEYSLTFAGCLNGFLIYSRYRMLWLTCSEEHPY